MRRREFLVFLGGAATACPGAVLAQPADQVRRIGVLMANNADARIRIDAIRQGLQELGWIEGRNILIEVRWAAADAGKLRAFAKELAGQRPDLIIAHSSPAVKALLAETRTIPIVFVQVADPVGQDFVRSSARPGGNVTGFSNFEPSLGGKWLEILKEVAPGTSQVAVLYNPDTAPFSGLFLRSVEAAAPSFGIAPAAAPVREVAEIEGVISAQAHIPGGALVVLTDIFTTDNRERIAEIAARYRLPAVYPFSHFAAVGGLISYGIDANEPFRQAPSYVDRILRGEKPGDLPIQGPTKFELVINLKTAKALGIELPRSLLLRADEVIE